MGLVKIVVKRVLDKVVFFCLLCYFASRVTISFKWFMDDKIGQTESTYDGRSTIFPSITICPKGNKSIDIYSNAVRFGSPAVSSGNVSDILVSVEHAADKSFGFVNKRTHVTTVTCTYRTLFFSTDEKPYNHAIIENILMISGIRPYLAQCITYHSRGPVEVGIKGQVKS
jgi:hypothetical protein